MLHNENLAVSIDQAEANSNEALEEKYAAHGVAKKLNPKKSVHVQKNVVYLGATIHTTATILQTGQAISDGLNAIPEIPNTPIEGKGAYLNLHVFGQPILGVALGLGSLLNVTETWKSIKDLYYAENKNYEKVVNVAINLFRTTVVVLCFAAVATGVAYALPILLPVSAGVGAAWGLFHVVKKAYQAYKAHKEGDKEARNRLLREMVPHVFSTLINGIGVGLTIMLTNIGDSLHKAHDMFLDGVKNFNFKEIATSISLTQTAGKSFESIKLLGYTLAGITTLGAVPSFTRNVLTNFNETAQTFLHPIRSLRKFGNAVVDKCKESGKFVKKTYGVGIVALPVIAALEVVSTALTATARLIQFGFAANIKLLGKIGTQLKYFFSLGIKKEDKGEAIPRERVPASSDPIVGKLLRLEREKKIAEQQKQKEIEEVQKAAAEKARKEQLIAKKHTELKALLNKQEKSLGDKTDKKNYSKRYAVQELKKKIGATPSDFQANIKIADIEKEALVISPLLKQSFFKDVSRTQILLDKTKNLEALINDEVVHTSALTA